jgi:mannan endo-1,4-beta-mannosidase
MKSRLVTILAVLLAAFAVGAAATLITGPSSSPPPAAHASLAPELASYLGAFETGVPPGYGPVSQFAQAAGRQPNLIGYYSGWAEPFNTSFAQTMHQHGIIPFVQIDPTDASIAAIAAGTYDVYLRSYADSVRDFRHSVVIGFGHEMNATWYKWGYGHVPPATFVAAWRHIVSVFRASGADNVTWLWTIQADQAKTGPIGEWWPGSQYVTWVGIDGYYYGSSSTFANVFGKTIDQVRTFTSQPVLLSETAVGPNGSELSQIHGLFKGMVADKTLGLVWFDEAQHGSLSRQDWRIEDNSQATIFFQLAVSEYLSTTMPTG